jgi:predicted nucleotidyltransferase
VVCMDIGKIKENLRKREMLKKESLRHRFEAASRDFDKIVRMIIDKYAPKKIIQWGSLLHPEQFDTHSDIDIALEGISDAETYFALLGDAMALTRFHVDIVQLEKIEPEFAELILLKGKIIYES